ncbi:SRPBCC family protein [Luteimonas sp. RD2P54]|uniref:SRPBCC family protein n=1 Tax=Luteimonas endophytica TaxID=3042023 RepID=A0ABT6JCL0_9GAMM|nr:SRPBCC family protein [Luteimonas endophytica]MDH5823933.1 SRPBCC family protein [Luteimonas endophytica]
MNDSYAEPVAAGTVRIERLLPGPLERVWNYLTDPDKRRLWLAAGEIDLRVGGRAELLFHNDALTGHDDPTPVKYTGHGGPTRQIGRVTACTPRRLLAYTWGGEPDGASEVRFELEERGDAVLLVLTHRRLRSHNAMVSVASGWHAHLGVLLDRLHGRAPASFWPAHTRLEQEYEARLPQP